MNTSIKASSSDNNNNDALVKWYKDILEILSIIVAFVGLALVCFPIYEAILRDRAIRARRLRPVTLEMVPLPTNAVSQV